MSKTTTGLEYFRQGYNCAQSVLIPFASEFKFNKEQMEALSLGFGAGMGRLQKTCGALTGTFMVIGLINNRLNIHSQEKKQNCHEMIQDVYAKFSHKFGNTDCTALINTDLNTPEGRKKMDQENSREIICEKCISYCISWLESRLKQAESLATN